MSEENEDFIGNDLSFLEDIDIDGIVEYLSETDNFCYTKRKEYDGLKLMPKDNSPIKKIKINTKKSKTDRIKQILENNYSLVDKNKHITICISDDHKGDNEVSEMEENASIKYMFHVLPKLQDVDNVKQVTTDTELTKDDDKVKLISTNELRTDLVNSNESIGNNNTEKHKNLQENIKDISNNTNNLSVINSKEQTKIVLNSNEETNVDKPEKYDGLKANLDVSKIVKLSSAISVVSRKDDLHLADKLQKRLYEFLKVTFSDINVIHYGRYSKIFKCQQKGKQYALKVINSDLDVKQFGIEKGKMLNKLQQNIARDELHFVYLFASFRYEMGWGFLFDFFQKNLREELQTHGPMHISTVENLYRQLIIALNRLRLQQIIHSDIKPEHILLNESATVLKICGFDRAYHMDEETILPNIGTPSYRAPEVILGYSASFSIDMWSTGLVIYEMMTNIKLFRGSFNNYILFKQMCLLGNMPSDMITNSIYGINHFYKRSFLKREGVHGKNIRVIHNFVKNNSYKREPYRIYNKHWRHATGKISQEEDIKKISTLVGILHNMLLLHPDNRIPIQVLYDHPIMMRTFY